MVNRGGGGGSTWAGGGADSGLSSHSYQLITLTRTFSLPVPATIIIITSEDCVRLCGGVSAHEQRNGKLPSSLLGCCRLRSMHRHGITRMQTLARR